MIAEPRRIAFVLPNMGGGGAERVALTIAGDLVRRGFAVDIVLVRAEGELLAQLPPGVTLVDLNVGRFVHALLPLARYLRRRRPVAIQVRMWPLTVIAIMGKLLSRTRTRVVVSDHVPLGVMYGESPRALRAIAWTTRLLYPLADARIFVSRGAAEDLARLSGLSAHSFEVIYNPIPRAAPCDTRDAEALWDGAHDRIVTVGTLKPVKNHALLLDAFALLLPSRPRARLMLVGSGECEADLRARAHELGITSAVTFAGFTADPAPFYKTASLFVLASDYEGFGNVLVEAMRQGTPVVSTDCETGPREILDHGRFGALVPTGDARALAEAMMAMLESPTDCGLLVARAEELSGERTVDRYLALLLGSPAP